MRFAITDLWFGFDTPALVYDKGGGFNRSAHSAGPGTGQRAEGREKRDEGRAKRERGKREEARG